MKKLLLSLALLVAANAFAAEGYVTKSASGTTSATVLFPAGPPLRITAYDVTADNATNRLIFQSGTVGATVAKAAASSATFVTLLSTSLVTNNQVLFQDANENTAVGIVATNGTTTHKLVSLNSVLGTNLAVGDTVNKRLNAAYTTLLDAGASATAFFVDTTNNLAGSDVVVADLAAGVWKGTVSSVTRVTNHVVNLRGPVRRDVAVASEAYERFTNYANVSATAAAGTLNIQVATTNGFTNGAVIIIETATGDLVADVVTTVSTTNITATTPLPFALAINDRVNLLHDTALTASFPAVAGDRAVILGSRANLAANDELVFIPAAAAPWRGTIASFGGTNLNTLTLSGALNKALPTGSAFYKLTNSHLTVLSALRTATEVVLNNATNLSAGDPLIISPASGGAFRNLYGAAADHALTTVGFTAQTGLALAAGDSVYLLGTTNSTLVGAATLRADGTALYSVDRRKPLKVMITGAAACSLNSVTAKYD